MFNPFKIIYKVLLRKPTTVLKKVQPYTYTRLQSKLLTVHMKSVEDKC